VRENEVYFINIISENHPIIPDSFSYLAYSACPYCWASDELDTSYIKI